MTINIENIKTLIKLTGLKKDEFAAKIGISRVTIYRILNGSSEITEKYKKLILAEYSTLILNNLDKFKE